MAPPSGGPKDVNSHPPVQGKDTSVFCSFPPAQGHLHLFPMPPVTTAGGVCIGLGIQSPTDPGLSREPPRPSLISAGHGPGCKRGLSNSYPVINECPLGRGTFRRAASSWIAISAFFREAAKLSLVFPAAISKRSSPNPPVSGWRGWAGVSGKMISPSSRYPSNG